MKEYKFRITPPLLALMLANVIPIFGVLFMHWDIASIVVLYWAENLVVGGYTILKMLAAGRLGAIGPVLFFCLHYGGFCAVHGLFVLKLTEYAGGEQAVLAATTWPEPLAALQLFYNLVNNVLTAATADFRWVLLAMALSHGVSFLLLYLGQGEYRNTTVSKLMRAPYTRIVVLHIAVIAGGFLVAKMGSPLGLLLALVALKTGMDIMLHNRSHKTAGAAVATQQQEPTGG